MSIHRTDCVNIIHLSEAERVRLIDAEWETSASEEAGGQYMSLELRCMQIIDKVC